MKKIIRRNFYFLFPWSLFVLIGGIVIARYPKEDIHLYINQFHSHFFNYFFYYSTLLGDGIVIVIIVIALLFIKFRFSLLVGIANGCSSLLTQGLKHLVFDGVVRPKKFFEGGHNLNLVPGVENYYYNSFPSGHTAAAFTTFFCLALCTENKFLKLLCFFTAITVGFSRVYLSQHFFNDVYAGSIIGVLISLFIYRCIVLNEQLGKKQWMEKSLLKK